MTICSLSLLALFVSGIVMYLFREPSEEEFVKQASEAESDEASDDNLEFGLSGNGPQLEWWMAGNHWTIRPCAARC